MLFVQQAKKLPLKRFKQCVASIVSTVSGIVVLGLQSMETRLQDFQRATETRLTLMDMEKCREQNSYKITRLVSIARFVVPADVMQH